ncbi:MAG: hypothetical protein ACMXYK_02220 [Candidatus Woesearchaeota archaeon]
MKNDKPDYFTADLNRLKSGAKLVTASLVRDKSRLLLVPETYEDIRSSILSKEDIVIRSDHPEEYVGLAGLLESISTNHDKKRLKFSLLEDGKFNDYWLSQEDNLRELRRKTIEENRIFQRYISLTQRKSEDFLKNFKFTFWQKIPGTNGSMWADPVVPKKYHFIHVGESDRGIFINYSRLNTETGEFSSNGGGGKIQDNLPRGSATLHKLVDAYEEVRDFDEFNNNHCYEMEHQIDEKGNLWFLQWRRMRDFTPTSFKIERSIEPDEEEGSFAFGATPPEGVYLKTQHDIWGKTVNPEVEAITAMDPTLPCTRYPNAKAVLFNHSSFNYFVIRGFTHASRELFGGVNLLTHLPYSDKRKLCPDEGAIFRYISDGQRCLIKRMT